jgi:hypothetical protein
MRGLIVDRSVSAGIHFLQNAPRLRQLTGGPWRHLRAASNLLVSGAIGSSFKLTRNARRLSRLVVGVEFVVMQLLRRQRVEFSRRARCTATRRPFNGLR